MREMHDQETEERVRLRVLLANENEDGLKRLATEVDALGHEVIAFSIVPDEVAEITAEQHPDVALVSLGPSTEHALGLIERIVGHAKCPVIALIHSPRPEFVRAASKSGVFAVVTDRDPSEWQCALDVVLRRFAEYSGLQEAFSRRVVIERANGILMERHSVSGDDAFNMLRDQARSGNRKLIDLATAVVDGHALLPPARRPA